MAAGIKKKPGSMERDVVLLCLLCEMILLLGFSGCRFMDGTSPTGGGDQETKGFEVKIVPEPGMLSGKQYAVCIGVSSYQNLPDLRYAHLDAEDVYDFLISDTGGYEMENCVLLCDTTAEGGRVLRQQIESLFTTWMARVRPEDSVFIFFSGHGLPLGRDRAFMAGWDTDPDDLYPTAIPMSRLREYLDEMILAERVVVALDTCFSGNVSGKTFLPQGQRMGLFEDSALEQVVQGKGRVILTAARGGQAAHELAALNHGIFTYCMLQGLRGEANLDGDEKVTLSELWLYLQGKVPEEAGRRGLRQNPVRKGGETGEIVLARARLTRPEIDSLARSQTEEVVTALLGGARLMGHGFYDRAIEKFLQARPFLPPEKQAVLEALIEECHTLASRETLENAVYPPDAAALESAEIMPLTGSLGEADFLDGQRAEAQGLWEVALAFYGAALEQAPEDERAVIEERIAACRMEGEADTLYGELKGLFKEAEARPSRAAFQRVREKIKDLKALGKDDTYRDLGYIRSCTLSEDTSDESRKYFGWGTRSLQAGQWREAVQWFEKAREGAGGRYPDAIETNIRFCRISLEKE
ncbi:MAG: caspase family protein, partial [Planctomycetota bacterium]